MHPTLPDSEKQNGSGSQFTITISKPRSVLVGWLVGLLALRWSIDGTGKTPRTGNASMAGPEKCPPDAKL